MATTLAANLIIDDGKLLMLYRDDHEYWELPAGKVEDGETPRQAAVREAREEIGCDVVIRSSWSRFDLDFEHDGRTFKTRGFVSDIVDGDPEPQEAKFSKLTWMTADDLTELELAPNLREIRDHLRLFLLRST